VLWEVSGSSSEFKSKDEVVIHGPSLLVPLEQGMAELRAGFAKLDIQRQLCWLSSNVQVLNVEGMSLSSGELKYSMEDKILLFSKGFVMSRDFYKVEGREGYYRMETGLLKTDGRTDLEVMR
jgi:hypothetical protein